MAEASVLVCDVCGRPAVETVTIRVGRRNLAKDLCQAHLQELTAGARTPRPGRPRATVVATPAKRRGRPPGSKNKAKSTTGRRRSRARKSVAKATVNGRRKKAS
jgi:hypothetical protein